MGRFSVDPAELRDLGRELSAVHDDVTRVSGRLSSLSGTATGHPGLAQALGDFAEHWEYALSRIGEHAGELGPMLVHAADAYEAVDAEAAKAARG
jgi:Family of unknown function (DUF6507)